MLKALLIAVRRRPRGTFFTRIGHSVGCDAWRRPSPETECEPEGELLGVNAMAELFFGGLKKKRIKKQIIKLAKADVVDYIDTFYK